MFTALHQITVRRIAAEHIGLHVGFWHGTMCLNARGHYIKGRRGDNKTLPTYTNPYTKVDVNNNLYAQQ